MGKVDIRFSTLKVYPRVQYFATRLKTLLPRLERVTGKLPSCFQNNSLIEEIKQLNREFGSGLRVRVFGEDLCDDISNMKLTGDKCAICMPCGVQCRLCQEDSCPHNIFLDLIDKYDVTLKGKHIIPKLYHDVLHLQRQTLNNLHAFGVLRKIIDMEQTFKVGEEQPQNLIKTGGSFLTSERMREETPTLPTKLPSQIYEITSRKDNADLRSEEVSDIDNTKQFTSVTPQVPPPDRCLIHVEELDRCLIELQQTVTNQTILESMAYNTHSQTEEAEIHFDKQSWLKAIKGEEMERFIPDNDTKCQTLDKEIVLHIFRVSVGRPEKESIQAINDESAGASPKQAYGGRFLLLKGMPRDSMEIDSYKTMFGPDFVAVDEKELHRKISNHLESRIVKGLVRIFSFLRTLEPVFRYRFPDCKDEVLFTTRIKKSIQNFLGTEHDFFQCGVHGQDSNVCAAVNQKQAVLPKGILIPDFASVSKVSNKERTGSSDGETPDFYVLNGILQSLSRSVKCAAVDQFGNKYNLPKNICNSLLLELGFEEALLQSVSKNTLYHLLKKCADTTKRRRRRHNYVLYMLQNDMKLVFLEAEERLSTFSLLSSTIKKMNFEVLAYLRKSFDETAKQISEELALSPMIDVSVREALHRIEGVCGTGNIYGNLEIHLDKNKLITRRKDETKEFMTRGKEAEQRDTLSACERKIFSCLMKHRFTLPYSVKFVCQGPKECIKLMPGHMVKSPVKVKKGELEAIEYNKGTLGGYCKIQNRLYALTCAHVVGDSEKIYVENSETPFSQCIKKYRSGEHTGFSCVDIAALEVSREVDQFCRKSIERDYERISEVKICRMAPVTLAGNKVHKFGASTGFTEGVILSVDYSYYQNVIGTNTEQYVILIDHEANVSDNFVVKWDPIQVPPEEVNAMTRIKNEIDATETFENHSWNKMHKLAADCNISVKTDTSLQKIPVKLFHHLKDSESTDCHQKSHTGESPVATSKETETTGDCKEETMEGAWALKENIVKLEKEDLSEEVCSSSDKRFRTCAGKEEDQCSIPVSIDAYCFYDERNLVKSVYVRDISSLEDKDILKSCDCVFGEEGDSGAIICVEDSPGCISHSALSMFFGGDFQVDGHAGKICMSFMLFHGLALLGSKF